MSSELDGNSRKSTPTTLPLIQAHLAQQNIFPKECQKVCDVVIVCWFFNGGANACDCRLFVQSNLILNREFFFIIKRSTLNILFTYFACHFNLVCKRKYFFLLRRISFFSFLSLFKRISEDIQGKIRGGVKVHEFIFSTEFQLMEIQWLLVSLFNARML